MIRAKDSSSWMLMESPLYPTELFPRCEAKNIVFDAKDISSHSRSASLTILIRPNLGPPPEPRAKHRKNRNCCV